MVSVGPPKFFRRNLSTNKEETYKITCHQTNLVGAKLTFQIKMNSRKVMPKIYILIDLIVYHSLVRHYWYEVYKQPMSHQQG